MVSVENQFEFQNQSEPCVVKQIISNYILFQFFRSQAESDQGHEGGSVAKDVGGKEEKG